MPSVIKTIADSMTGARRADWWLGRRFRVTHARTVLVTIDAYETKATGRDVLTVSYRDASRREVGHVFRDWAEGYVDRGDWVEV